MRCVDDPCLPFKGQDWDPAEVARHIQAAVDDWQPAVVGPKTLEIVLGLAPVGSTTPSILFACADSNIQ